MSYKPARTGIGAKATARRNLLARAALVVGSLLFVSAVLAGIEWRLRADGRGLPQFEWFYDASLLSPTRVFVAAEDGSGELVTDPLLVRADQIEQRFPAVKPAGSKRVFFVGDSTTAGWPYLRGSSPAWVRAMLKDLQPGAKVEIINAGFHGFDSVRLQAVVREISRDEPDLVIYRAGYDDYSAYRLRHPPNRYEAIRRAVHSWLVLHSRIYNLLLERLRGRPTAMSRTGVILTPGEIDGLLAQYATTVDRSLSLLQERGVRTVVLSLPFSAGLLGEGHPMIHDALPRMNEIVKKAALGHGAEFLELRGLKPSDFMDSVHSTADGYRKIALQVARDLCDERIVSTTPCDWHRLRPEHDYRQELGLLDPEYLAHLHLKLAVLYLNNRHDSAKAYGEFLESEKVAPNSRIIYEEVRGNALGAPAIEMLARATERLGFHDRALRYLELLKASRSKAPGGH